MNNEQTKNSKLSSKKDEPKRLENKIKIIIDPATNSLTWDEFLQQKGPMSIALDGYVAEGPKFDISGPKANFNHHEGVSRMETRATCAQIRMAVQQGLFTLFKNEKGEPYAEVWVNDCDQDVCFSFLILKHPDVIENEEFLRLMDIVDVRDTTGGFCAPSIREEDSEILAWIFEPYQNLRSSGQISKRDPREFNNVIETVILRTLQHLDGNGEKIKPLIGYEKIGGGSGWAMVHEESTDARMHMHADGIRAFVSVQNRQDGKWNYSIGKASQYVHFPMLEILLAKFQASESDSKHTWGGSDLIGGCNRVYGSSLSPQKITDLIETEINK